MSGMRKAFAKYVKDATKLHSPLPANVRTMKVLIEKRR
eukprot:gene22366-16794_t